MVSDNRNKTFLYRISWILGGRDKHPWGRSIGLKNSRIDSMFRGHVPQVDALERIRRAERVNLDWLISGEGAPYVIPNMRDDDASSEALKDYLQDGNDYVLYILAGRADAAVVLTLPVAIDYEDGTEASFVDVVVIQPAGPRTLEVAAKWRDRRVVPVGSDVLMRLRSGWLGPKDLLGDKANKGVLADAQPVDRDQVGQVAEQIGKYWAGGDEQETLLVQRFREISPEMQTAVLTIVQGLGKDVKE